MTTQKKIKVLVVDDSAFMRTAIERMLVADPVIELIGSAANGREAVEKVIRLRPDVVTMDIEMPIMDGLHALKEIMRLCPTPVLMVSSLTKEGAKTTLDAMELGAIDYVPKPGSTLSASILTLKEELLQKIHAAAGCQPKAVKLEYIPGKRHAKRASTPADEIINRAVFIGASTGGPPAVQKILSLLDPALPAPIVIAQHMPKAFTAAFASRLNMLCGIKVKEANDGETMQNSIAYICPGDHQTRVTRSIDGKYCFAIVSNSNEQDRFAPCINTLFFSAAKEFAHKAVGVILTGMGEDGVRGLKNIKLMGGLTIAQDRASSVVYGMPRAALEQEAAVRILNLDEISKEIELALK
ncbi:MAG: chemotaxis response regulator protein-glutamate methylesterase [Candidatus Riflebacteria bacterium HGW-Riflebacteria-2]|jgi:two-component system chemotaxis response regulator CheB|nr:MAG: chemotaxis response regulator protein-glutamate methylesterase [Candidatus Riflebacteria bacterium HGW-Riflebacteria-2]